MREGESGDESAGEGEGREGARRGSGWDARWACTLAGSLDSSRDGRLALERFGELQQHSLDSARVVLRRVTAPLAPPCPV